MLEDGPPERCLFISPLHVCKASVPVALFKAYFGYKKQHVTFVSGNLRDFPCLLILFF